MTAPQGTVRLGDLSPRIERRSDGSLLVRATQSLGAYPPRFTERLSHWARVAPDRTLFAWRDGGRWSHLSFGAALDSIRHLGQALLDRRLSPDRPLVILSGNDRDHLLLALAAQHVGIPYAPISPAYSLLSTDFGALKHALRLVTPGMVFVADQSKFSRAIDDAVDPAAEIVAARPAPGARQTTAFDTLLATRATDAVERAHQSIQPDTIAKILFTSGSTGSPKGVVNTHRMLCSNQQMILQTLPFLGDEPPVLVDWLPWHHTFGGNHNIGIVVYNGGSLYLDEGRPMPGAFDESARNLKEIAPTVYMNVPKGFEELLRAFRADGGLAETFFGSVRCLFYAGAGLSQHVAEAVQAIAIETCGKRLPIITGLGATETAPMALCRPWDSPIAAAVGLPVPGLEAKLVPVGDRLEVRVRGPNVTPGFWREEALTRAAFDDEGFYRMGDAVRPVDAADLAQGFVFDGRIAEDFKLSSGTWVHVGALRARIILHFGPYIRDAVITGHNRSEIGMLAVPDLAACRSLCADLPADAPAADVLAHPGVRSQLAMLLAEFANTATGSASRVVRAVILEVPPSLDAQEVTDKGSLNQRAVLTNRAALVDELYAEPAGSHVITGTPGRDDA